jgi:glutamate/tyrosine decarboxylase-like PLP-dependent enzyme
MNDRSKWEWTEEEIRRVGYQVVDLISEYLTQLPHDPVFRPCPDELIERFADAPLPRTGQNADSLLGEFRNDVLAHPFGNGHPRFFGWVNSPPAVIGIFADALAATMNPSVAGGNHASVYVEHQVLRWFKELIGFPNDGSAGLLVSGGSMAHLTGLTVARHVKLSGVRQAGMQQRTERAIAYMSAEGHTCIRKSLELLGIGSDNIRLVPLDDRLRMRPAELERMIREDLQHGAIPVVVAASAGTASTGTIDPLAEIRDVCQRQNVWFHVDAAYGGPSVLSSRYRDDLSALRDADSLVLDPHKWMSVPVEAGLSLVRDGAAMRDAFSLVPAYIRTEGNSSGVLGPPWFSEYGFQQTRGFRALKVWMTLKFFGAEGYAQQVERDLSLAGRLAERVRRSDLLELGIEPSLSIVCFRAAPASLKGQPEALDDFNQRLLETVQLGGTAFVSSTRVNGRFWLRACVINHRTSEADIDVLVAHIEDVALRI